MERHVDAHRAFAADPAHRTARARIRRLETLRDAIVAHGEELVAALREDLGKPEIECYGADIGPVLAEIAHAARRVRRWMRPKRTGRGAFLLPSPYGAALIVGTWNYPVQLTLSPLVGAIAAGNGVTVKPSELAPATAEVIRRLISGAFSPADVVVELGGPEVANALIDEGYDKLFFTGSPRVGALVAERAARYHTAVTLELGGKSPAIVARDSDVAFTAGRVAWGKFVNAGQTCMAPDYLLAPEERADELVEAVRAAAGRFYGADPKASPDFARIVNERHHDRLAGLLARSGVTAPADRDDRYVAPTVVRTTLDSPLMQEEIFGPILPVITYRSEEEIPAIVERNRNPLAVYVFSRDRGFARRMLDRLDFGGGMVNDVIVHSTNPRLPFGGRGTSGTGSYHGEYGFAAFSHVKGVARTRQGRADSFRFPPYRPLPRFVRRLLFGL